MDALLQKIEPKIFMLVMSGVLLLFAGGLFAGLIWPGIKDYRAAVHTRALLENVAKSGDQLEKQLASIEQEVESLGRQLHGDMINLPEKQLEGFIIGRLQEISWSHNVELISVRPSKGNVVQIFQEMLFEVEVGGDYFDLFAWLQELGTKLGFVVVKQYFIQPTRTDVVNPPLKVRLTMVSYRRA